MIAVTVSKTGAEVARVHFFGDQSGEESGFRVVSGALAGDVAQRIWEALLWSPVPGTVGDYAYRIGEPPQPESPRLAPRRRRW